jgi:UDP-glucose 4-epimerase/UDP-arabinose 4-epimerase
VVDLAQAHVLAVARLIGGGDSRILNVGTGEGVTVMQMIEAAERTLGLKVPYQVGPRRAGDPPSLVADSRQIKALLGWKPVCSDLDSLIRDAALWQRDPLY